MRLAFIFAAAPLCARAPADAISGPRPPPAKPMRALLRMPIAAALMVWAAPFSASSTLASQAFVERQTRTIKPVVACTSWAAWREFGQASLTARGARMGKNCPIRLAARTKVLVVEEDAGAGATEIRHRGRTWFVDAQALD